jgi:hypothetical protein
MEGLVEALKIAKLKEKVSKIEDGGRELVFWVGPLMCTREKLACWRCIHSRLQGYL